MFFLVLVACGFELLAPTQTIGNKFRQFSFSCWSSTQQLVFKSGSSSVFLAIGLLQKMNENVL
jgi:hypothetical protein